MGGPASVVLRPIGVARTLAEGQALERAQVVVAGQPDLLEVVVALRPRAASRAAWTAGNKRAIRTAMMAMTTSSSINVKPLRNFFIYAPLQARRIEKNDDDQTGLIPQLAGIRDESQTKRTHQSGVQGRDPCASARSGTDRSSIRGRITPREFGRIKTSGMLRHGHAGPFDSSRVSFLASQESDPWSSDQLSPRDERNQKGGIMRGGRSIGRSVLAGRGRSRKGHAAVNAGAFGWKLSGRLPHSSTRSGVESGEVIGMSGDREHIPPAHGDRRRGSSGKPESELDP